MGKAALVGQPGVLDVVKSVRPQPFGEWNIVYFDPQLADPAKILARLRAKGCPKAQEIAAAEARENELRVRCENPIATPGDSFRVTLQTKDTEAKAIELVLPEKWIASHRKPNPRTDTAIWIQSPSTAKPGKYIVRLRTADKKELAFPVELVRQVR